MITQQTKKKEEINGVTGEIVVSEEITEQIHKFPKTADFVMAFTKDLGYMKHLTKGEMLTLFGLLQIVNNENEIILNMAIKKRISNDFDLSIKSFDVQLSNLKKKKVIIQQDRGVYLLQPNLFGKGKWSDISKMRIGIEWDFKNQTKQMGIELEYKDEKESIQEQIKKLQQKAKELEDE